MIMYTYKTFREGVWHIYSNEYLELKECVNWYLNNGEFLENLSNRKLVLFRGSKKVKL